MKGKGIFIKKLIIFLTIFSIIFCGVNVVLRRKMSYQKNYDFLHQKEVFDVLFFGSSHMLNTIYPMQLWKDYGIVSYNLGKHGERPYTTYYNMILALKHHKPKLIVVDAYLMGTNEKFTSDAQEKSYIHQSLDSYPISFEKYFAIKDIFNGENLLDNEIEYLFNFSLYHSRWSKLSKEDFTFDNIYYEKGAESRIGVATPKKMSEINSIAEYTDEETIGMQYMRKIIEYANQNNIPILITYLPHPASDTNIAHSKHLDTICKEYNVDYINFLNTNLVDFDIDCYDEASHLNVSGARKITDYMGKYLTAKYKISDQRNNEVYNFWNTDYDEYIDFKIENFKANEENLNNYLMLLYNENDIKYEITISSKLNIKNDKILEKLLNNLDNKYKIDDSVFSKNPDKKVLITTYDNRNNNKIADVWF